MREKFKHFRCLLQILNDRVYQYYLSFERVHLGNFLLGIQSFQCWTGPEMIVPLLVSTVKNQEMVYNPKIRRKQHKKITFYLNMGLHLKWQKNSLFIFLYFKYVKLYTEHKTWERSQEKRNLSLIEGQTSLIP